MPTRQLAIIPVLVFIVSALGCSSIPRWQFELARRLEHQDQTQAAVLLYERTLKDIPDDDVRWRSETYYHMGECLWAMGDVPKAFSSFQRAVDVDGSNIAARLRLGVIFLAGGAADRAGEQAAVILQHSYTNTEALALLGAASSASGHELVAEAAFRRVLEKEPGRETIAVALADILNARDQVDDARQVLRNASTAGKGSVALLALGRLEEQQGHASAAEQAYRMAASRENTPEVNLRLAHFLERSLRVTEARDVLRRIDQLRPTLPTALPDFELLSGRAPVALEQYLQAVRSQAVPRSEQPDPGGAMSNDRAPIAARIIEADILTIQAAHDPAKAAEAVRLRMEQYRRELDPATTAMLQAELALAEGDVSAAASHAGTAVQSAPGSAASHYIVGVVKHRSGDTRQAHDAWLKSLEQDDKFVPARLALAQEALRDRDLAAAEQNVLPAVREEPANVAALNLYARVLLARGRLAGASVIASRASALAPNAAEPHVVIGTVALRQGDYAASLVEFQKAIVKNQDSLDAIEGLVEVYRRGAITRPMLRNMENVAAARPESATLMELAGRLYAQSKWMADAERALQRALAIDPHRSTAAAAMATLLASKGRTQAATLATAGMGRTTAALVSALNAQRRNEVESAISQYETAIRAGDQSGVAANNLAWLYAQQGTNLDRALSLAERARLQAPADPAILDTVGFVHLRRREFSRAIEVLQQARTLATSSPQRSRRELAAAIRQHLGEALLRAGITAGAGAGL